MSIITFKEKQIVIDESWISFFEENQEELSLIESKIGNNFSPKPEDIFKIFLLPKDQIKTVIIGQDPYPQEGVATGRCFEVLDTDWNKVNKSLKIILRSFYYHITGEVKFFKEILEEIGNRKWEFYAPNILFSKLQDSGVFLLNKSLTCEINKINSHKNIWSEFTKQVILELREDKKIKWLLWGKEAQKINKLFKIDNQKIETDHPNAYKSKIEFIKKSGLNLIEWDKILNANKSNK